MRSGAGGNRRRRRIVTTILAPVDTTYPAPCRPPLRSGILVMRRQRVAVAPCVCRTCIFDGQHRVRGTQTRLSWCRVTAARYGPRLRRKDVPARPARPAPYEGRPAPSCSGKGGTGWECPRFSHGPSPQCCWLASLRLGKHALVLVRAAASKTKAGWLGILVLSIAR